MKKVSLLLILTVFFTAPAMGKTFSEEFLLIYNRHAPEKIELIKTSSKQILDSLRKEESSATGEELAEIKKQIELFGRIKELQIVGGFDQTSISDELYEDELERLVSGYEELLKLVKGDTGGRLFVKYSGNKIVETVCWLEINLFPFDTGKATKKSGAGKMIEMMMSSMKVEVIIDFPLVRGMTEDEFFAFFAGTDPDDPEAQANISERFTDLFKIDVSDNDTEIVMGSWLEEDTPARE